MPISIRTYSNYSANPGQVGNRDLLSASLHSEFYLIFGIRRCSKLNRTSDSADIRPYAKKSFVAFLRATLATKDERGEIETPRGASVRLRVAKDVNAIGKLLCPSHQSHIGVGRTNNTRYVTSNENTYSLWQGTNTPGPVYGGWEVSNYIYPPAARPTLSLLSMGKGQKIMYVPYFRGSYCFGTWNYLWSHWFVTNCVFSIHRCDLLLRKDVCDKLTI